ncbi:Cysteine-rich RLK (Receptor-like protein kinase) 8 [Abeliophyllum distichum]|uniref:Cysteine-rich RLK (Receptor-like protein kinase) 8 n=1 Tax=Abeliophyllum distichum TaxID=126358 RepID=A0ABD1QW86_9LAMI
MEEDEIKVLRKIGTWEPSDLPQGKKLASCKWIFTIKLKQDVSLDLHKARLIAKGFTQTYGIDYQETFAPVAKLNTIHARLSLATNKYWPLYQFEVMNTFINRDLERKKSSSPHVSPLDASPLRRRRPPFAHYSLSPAPNSYGDIISDLLCCCNIGEGGIVLAEAVHGFAPDIAVKCRTRSDCATVEASYLPERRNVKDDSSDKGKVPKAKPHYLCQRLFDQAGCKSRDVHE